MTTPEPRRVVIAEDEALIRMDLAEMLAEEGYDVVGQAADGEAAVGLAEEHRPDLVILDVKMPVLDGIAAAEQIARARIAPVVILTAFCQRDLVERARDAGAMAYLVKPFTRSDLVPAIEIAVSRFAELGRPGAGGRRPRRAAGDPQGRRPGQGRAPEGARPERARRVPLDPEDRHGPAPVDARGRRGRRRARRRLGSASGDALDGPTPTPGKVANRANFAVSRGETAPPGDASVPPHLDYRRTPYGRP